MVARSFTNTERDLGKVIVTALAATVVMLVALISSASAAIRIAYDPGGLITDYVIKYRQIQDSGEQVAVDGPCYSACTLMLGILPPEQICLTANAQFGFHAAARLDPNGNFVIDQRATTWMWYLYPMPIRARLARMGKLSGQMVYLGPDTLATLYPRCD